MYLVRLIYTSSVTGVFQHDDIAQILESARVHNQRNNVTGLLCFNSRIFLQCLEGSRSRVNETYHRILNDPRHERIILLNYKQISERDFDRWSMGYIPESSLTAPANLKYSGNPEFDPYDMSGDSAHRLMLSLKEAVPTQS